MIRTEQPQKLNLESDEFECLIYCNYGRALSHISHKANKEKWVSRDISLESFFTSNNEGAIKKDLYKFVRRNFCIGCYQCIFCILICDNGCYIGRINGQCGTRSDCANAQSDLVPHCLHYTSGLYSEMSLVSICFIPFYCKFDLMGLYTNSFIFWILHINWKILSKVELFT